MSRFIIPAAVGLTSSIILWNYRNKILLNSNIKYGLIPQHDDKKTKLKTVAVHNSVGQWDYLRTSDEDYIMYFSKNLPTHQQHRVLVRLPLLSQDPRFPLILKVLNLEVYRKTWTYPRKKEYFELSIAKGHLSVAPGETLLTKANFLVSIEKRLCAGENIDDLLLGGRVGGDPKELQYMLFFKKSKHPVSEKCKNE